MQLLQDVLDKSVNWLERRGVPHARHDAESLFAHGLGCKRLDLYLNLERGLTEDDLTPIRQLIQRRGQREPLQHLLGSVPFHEIQLRCDRRALIPRPETEELVERLRTRLSDKPPGSILDLGTGTGALALSLAKMFPEAHVVAVDADDDALSLARENSERLGFEERVTVLRSNWFDQLPAEPAFDFIVSNPPYLTDEEWAKAQPEVRDWEPKAALVSPAEGIADLQRIVQEALTFLNPGGLLALETGIEHHPKLLEQMTKAGYTGAAGETDFHRRPRYVFASRPT